jgi:hypothetical protein
MVREGRNIKELIMSSRANKNFSTIENKNENDMNNYKGIFYESIEEKKFYEGGAHFSYKDLFKKLKQIQINNPQSNYSKKSSKEHKEGKIYFMIKQIFRLRKKKPD